MTSDWVFLRITRKGESGVDWPQNREMLLHNSALERYMTTEKVFHGILKRR